jgi:hypothetical protein
MLCQVLPLRLQIHSYTLMDLAKEIAEEFDCPLCEILTPMGEALSALTSRHQVVFDALHNQIALV